MRLPWDDDEAAGELLAVVTDALTEQLGLTVEEAEIERGLSFTSELIPETGR